MIGALFTCADEADQGPAEEKQDRGGPSYVDGRAHLSFHSLHHQRVVKDCDGVSCRPADGGQAQDARQDAQSATQKSHLEQTDAV